MADPYDLWLVVRRVSDLQGNEPGGIYLARDSTAGNGATTANIGFKAMMSELEHVGSKCTEPLTLNVELLAGMKFGSEIEITVELSRVGGRFAFLKAAMRSLGPDKKKTLVCNLSAVFYNLERTPKSPPFPSAPKGRPVPPFEDFVSLRGTIEDGRRKNPLNESWDWFVDKKFAGRIRGIVEESRGKGEDLEKTRERIGAWCRTEEAEQSGWYFGHTSPTRPCDPISCVLFNDCFTPSGYVGLFAGQTHQKDGFPLVSITFNLQFLRPIRKEKARGLWARYRYKGDFADLEEREMVLRDQDGEAVCVGRQLIMWRRPLKKGEKL